MEWSVEGTAGQSSVPVPDSLIEAVIEAVDVPRGSFPFDPYRDYRLSSQQIRWVSANLQQAIQQRKALHEREVLTRLGLKQWESWVEGLLQSTEQRDTLLSTFGDLQALCVSALSADKGILVRGD